MSTISGRAPRHSTTERPVALVTTTWSGAVVRRTAALTRLVLGSIFLWAFLDKLLALGHDTGKNPVTGVTTTYGDAAWVHGASPTSGFLTHASGPFASAYHALAGHAVVDWLFMLGLLGIGLGLVLGVALRPVAAAGSLLLVMMWASTLPPANNPVLDDHLVDALVLVLLAALDAGRTWGLGGWWSRLAPVRRHPVLR
ncbi:hypothetical protein [Lapillicoccus jejuensis]|uniref:Thiosulfate dehydrogenase [quinone] large subunit n=1 Tax=Lapillicoccus jejuensis TaxID=402171 RepID=A0A542DXZ5_9MICO|nr:hypothetical protein [Lapillicoccus jejuensis]TQJ07945.1 thiosulfate dehydrogenase [quinone] large subunit [Lapillicoccus jejuensis]